MSRLKHPLLIMALATFVLLTGCTTLYKANCELEQAHYAQAIPIYQEYLADHPESIEARRNMGLALLRSGEIDDALAAFRSVLGKRPEDAYANLYLGVTLLYKGVVEEGMTSMERFDAPMQSMVGDEVKYQLNLLRNKLTGKTPSPEEARAMARQVDRAIAAAVSRQKEADRKALRMRVSDSDSSGCGC